MKTIEKHLRSSIMCLSGAVLVLSLLFPPWMYTFQIGGISQVTVPAGYASVFKPPQPRESGYVHGVAIDTSRLVVQSLAIAVAIAIGLALLSRKRE